MLNISTVIFVNSKGLLSRRNITNNPEISKTKYIISKYYTNIIIFLPTTYYIIL